MNVKSTKQTSLMVQRALNNLCNYFLNNQIIPEAKVKKQFKLIQQTLELEVQPFTHEPKCQKITKNFYQDIEVVRQYLITKNPQWNVTQLENYINYLFSLLTPSQKELDQLYKTPIDVMQHLRVLSLLNYYVKYDKNSKNIKWLQKTKYGNLKITINKAKPEKTIEQIKQEKENPVYDPNKPKCVICIENIGYQGSSSSDSRENLRVFKKEVNGDNWFLQYSPYEYVNDHFVLNNLEHLPMAITDNTVKDLIEFVDNNKKYFIGSNADLPIVGGSLLSHNHYQGGCDSLPVMEAKTIKSFKVDETTISVLKWPLNTIKITSAHKDEVINMTNYFINQWKKYQGPLVTNDNNNTCTLITKYKNNKFEVFLIYRNNGTSKDRPTGLFHVHPKRFNVKQENIGLMEAAGLAILPARLEREVDALLAHVNSKKLPPELQKHQEWFDQFKKLFTLSNKQNLFNYIGQTFCACLEDCKVLPDAKFTNYIESLINDEITLQHAGLKVSLLKHGMTIKQISYDNKNYLLEYDKKSSYYLNDIFLNSLVGPVAGRIENGTVNSKVKNWKLPVNSDNNYIHSMKHCCADKNFKFSKVTKTKDGCKVNATLTTFNPDVNATYKYNIKLQLKKQQLIIDYQITADNHFIANPTQHFYFNFNHTNPLDYKLNINEDYQVWNLNATSNPVALKNIKLKNKSSTIKEIANIFDKKQHDLICGYIDHPFKNNSNEPLVLQHKKQALTFSATIKDFVIYTQNYPSMHKFKGYPLSALNCGVCIESQQVPTSSQSQTDDLISFKKGEVYKNTITMKFE